MNAAKTYFLKPYKPNHIPSAAELVGAMRELYRRRRYRRNRVRLVVMAMLSGVGLRRSELAGLNLGDVDADGSLQDEVRVRRAIAKGNKPREVSLTWCGPTTLAYVRAWARMRRAMGAADGDPFVCSLDPGREGKRLTPHQVRRYAIAAMRYGGVRNWRRFTAHTLRHWFCTYCLDNAQIGVNNVRLAMGHSSLATTSRYAHAIPEKVTQTDIYAPPAPPAAATGRTPTRPGGVR